MCLQTFIVKTLIIENMHSHHIYMKWKEGASVQDSGKTERERVCVRVCRQLQIEVESVVKTAIGRTDHLGKARIKIDRFVLIAGRNFNSKDIFWDAWRDLVRRHINLSHIFYAFLLLVLEEFSSLSIQIEHDLSYLLSLLCL